MPNPFESIKFACLNSDSKQKPLWKALAAEFVGTFLLVFVACGSGLHGTNVQIAFASGLTLATVVQTIGHVSGGHVNPAVTFGVLISRKIPLSRAAAYIVVQCIGSIAAAATLSGLIEEAMDIGLGVTTPSVSAGKAVGIELLVTFILVSTVLGVCDEARQDLNGSSPLAIGLALATGILGFMPYTGASMNPARSFGPVVITGNWTEHWVYWVGPLLGGLLAALIYAHIFKAEEEKVQEEGNFRISTVSSQIRA